MVIDSTPIRSKARRNYDKVMKDLDRANDDIRVFHKEDRPQFEKWLNKTFSDVLTKIAETKQKLAEQQKLVKEIEAEAYYGDYATAFGRVMDRRAKGATEEEPPPEEEDPEAKEKARAQSEFEEEMEDFFSRIEEEFASEFAQKKRARELAEKNNPDRLKEVYRQLVRKLHPDKNPDQTTRHAEWWHETQTAYQAENLKKLELLLMLVEVEEKGSKSANVSVLLLITNHFKAALKGLKREMLECRTDPAWKFSEREDLKPLESETRHALETSLGLLKTVSQSLDKRLKGWEASANRARNAAQRSKVSETGNGQTCFY